LIDENFRKYKNIKNKEKEGEDTLIRRVLIKKTTFFIIKKKEQKSIRT